MLMPHSRALLDALRERQRAEIGRATPDYLGADEAADHMPGASDPAHYQLVLKKKRLQGVLQQMMRDAGYEDLARVAGFRRERMDDE